MALVFLFKGSLCVKEMYINKNKQVFSWRMNKSSSTNMKSW
jgi:hypothetical protein